MRRSVPVIWLGGAVAVWSVAFLSIRFIHR